MLQYGRNARTHLHEQAAALCTWLIEISRDKLEVSEGYVIPSHVEEIVEKMALLRQGKSP